jgi:RNA polymerase sigma-70 factor (ECF subfamily)
MVYRDLLKMARRWSRRADEAEDLVQDALIEAVRAGRSDLGDSANRRWLSGVIRNKASLAARSAARRRTREAHWHSVRPDETEALDGVDVAAALSGLPPSLKSIAALALSGHSRREIAYLLRLPDTALRQRLSALKRELRRRGISMPERTPGLRLDLEYGRIRDALLPMLVQRGGSFASHDPDGHLIVFRMKTAPDTHNRLTGGNNSVRGPGGPTEET